MNPSTPNSQEGTKAATYREGLERAMTLIWAEKNKHSVISETYFTLKKVWEELYHEAAHGAADKQ